MSFSKEHGMSIIFRRCGNGRLELVNQPKPKIEVMTVGSTSGNNGNGHIVAGVLPSREAMRIPDEMDSFVKRYSMGRKRCRGQKPRYKDHRRGRSRILAK